jgi:putative oxidoreductase
MLARPPEFKHYGFPRRPVESQDSGFFGGFAPLCHSRRVALSRELPSNVVLLVLRAVVGVNMACLHGWDKLHHFGARLGSVPDPLGIGPTYSLMVAVACEFIGGILLATGLVGRAGAFLVAFMSALTLLSTRHAGPWHQRELWALYLAASLTILWLGCGRYSLDAVVWKRFGRGGGKGASVPSKN